MSDDTEIQDFASEQTSSSDSESDEDPYESEDNHPYDFYSGHSPLYPYVQKTNQIVYEFHSGRKVARLREPRDLYGVSSDSFFHLPRWPYECQVIKEKIEHIEWDPPVPEPMYKPSGLEQEPMCVNPTESKVIYQLNDGWKESYFMCSRVGGSRSPFKPASPHSCEESDKTLVFESRFESGNLQKVVQVVMEEREILLYCDLHGHSRKQNVFMYGCKGRGAQSGSDSRLCERIFPLLLSKVSPDKFSFSACKFKVQRNKEGTGRVVMWKMGIRNSYTLEATFCGSSMGKRRGTHFSTKDLESLGCHFCDALLDYCDPDQTKYYSCVLELEEMVQQRVRCDHRLGSVSESALDDVLSDLDSSTRGSDSSDSNGPPAHLMELAGKVKPRRKLLKSKRERNSQRRPPERVPDRQEEGEGEKTKAAIAERWLSPEAAKLGSVRKLQNLQKVSKKNRLTKQQRAPLFQDLSTKKVSVIYLVFNAKGEVVTTKSLSRSPDVVSVTSTFNSFNWKRPLPIFKSLFSQRVSNHLEPSCYCVRPDVNDSFRPNTANHEGEDGGPEPARMSLPPPVYDRPSLRHCTTLWSGELLLEKELEGRALPPPARASESAPPAVATAARKAPDQSGHFVRRKSKKTGYVSSAPQNSDDHRGGGQKRENLDHLRPGKEETLLPAMAACNEVPPLRTDILSTTAAIPGGSVQNILPKMTTHPPTSHKSSASTRSLPLAKIRSRSLHSSKGAIQKRKLGKLVGPQPPEDRSITTDHANLPANTWKDILMGLEKGEGGGSGDRTIPAPSKGHLLKNGTSNGFGGCTRKPGQRVSLVPLPKTVPSSQ